MKRLPHNLDEITVKKIALDFTTPTKVLAKRHGVNVTTIRDIQGGRTHLRTKLWKKQ